MTARLNEQEWEMLSAYIDGRLSSFDKTRLDQRIQTDPQMAAAYRSLLKTRLILHSASKVKLRRNFYLTSEMVRPKGWIWLIPALNFGSATAAVLAVLLLILDMFPPALLMKSTRAPQATALMAQDSAARPAAEKPGITLTLATEVAAAREQGQGLGKNTETPNVPPLPAAKLPGSVTSGQVETIPATPAAQAVEAPQMFAAPPEQAQEPADVTAPSMKEVPAAVPAAPPAAQAAMPTEGEVLPSQAELSEKNGQPNVLQSEAAVIPTQESKLEPTGQTAEEIILPSPAGQIPAVTQQATALPEQKLEEGPIASRPVIVAAPVTETMPSFQPPTVVSGQPAEKVKTIPISLVESWVKVGWIALLIISGILALISLGLKKKSFS